MSRPWEVVQGVVFDGRAIVISVAGMFGGPLPVVMAGGVAIVHRFCSGGIGTLAGIIMIVSSGALGIGAYYGRQRWSFFNRIAGLYCFGLLVHVNVVLWTLILPREIVDKLFESITVPVLVIYPIATVLLGVLLVNLEQKVASDQALRLSWDRLGRMVDQWGEQRLIQCRMIVEHMPQRVFVKDLNSVYIACNQTYARDLGLEPPQIVGKTDYDLFSREQAEKYRADDKEVCKQGQPWVVEERYVVGDVARWIRTTKAPMYDQDGIMVILGGFEDITARKNAEEALTVSEMRLKEAQQLTGIGHWQWDIATDQHTWSEEIYHIYGRDPALPAAVYPEVQQYFTPASWALLAAEVERGLAEGRPTVVMPRWSGPMDRMVGLRLGDRPCVMIRGT